MAAVTFCEFLCERLPRSFTQANQLCWTAQHLQDEQQATSCAVNWSTNAKKRKSARLYPSSRIWPQLGVRPILYLSRCRFSKHNTGVLAKPYWFQDPPSPLSHSTGMKLAVTEHLPFSMITKEFQKMKLRTFGGHSFGLLVFYLSVCCLKKMSSLKICAGLYCPIENSALLNILIK